MGDQELGSVMLPSSLFLKGQNARSSLARFQGSSTKRGESMGMAMQPTKQSTPFRSGASHALSPALRVRAKPVQPWLVLTAVLFGFFMAVLDMTIVTIAIQRNTR
jgi:hypothetical protein